jgi:hypothetical protein
MRYGNDCAVKGSHSLQARNRSPPTKVTESAPIVQDIEEDEDDAEDPAKTIPLTRYNAMLAIVKNTLFM